MAQKPKYLKECPSCGKNGGWEHIGDGYAPSSFEGKPSFKDAIKDGVVYRDGKWLRFPQYNCSNCGSTISDVPPE